MRRTGERISLYWNFIIHQIFPEFLQPLRDLRIQRVAQFNRGFFFVFFCFLLDWVPSCRPDLTGEMSLSIRSSRSRVRISLTVGEEDEVEEDDEEWLCCLEGVLEVDESDPEEELADKPGTTIGTKFSVLQGIRIPFKMRSGFGPLIHS